jgi:peptidoglycan/LPS O-acetylase OafA/YrhL
MLIVLFILIAGLWAAFLLPSFFDHRNQTPKSTTKDFARTKQLLATVSASDPTSDAYVRKHAQVRRTRVLIGLGIAAVVTLAVATWTGSVPWLYAAIAVDVTIAVYVTVLLHLKQQRFAPRAQVVPIGQPTQQSTQQPQVVPQAQIVAAQAPQAVQAYPTVVEDPQEEYAESKTVRVIAG